MIFTDRSRFRTFFKCNFERYLRYHYLKYGISKQGFSIPLATGTYAHAAIEMILNLVKTTDELPRSEDIREIVNQVTDNYTSEVLEAGFQGLEANERVEHILNEQTALISGLTWSWAIFVLPHLIEEYAILHVEQEMEKIVGCTCGLANIGEVKDHVARNCNAVVIMTRPDLVAKSHKTGALVYDEFKTGSRIDASTFDGDVQFAFGACGIEGYTGEELTESYVHALSKGYRKKGYNYETKQYDKPPVQSSSLCYAYVSGGISGMVPQDISFKYTKKKGYKKTPVWEIEFANIPEGIPLTEHYISLMSDDELESHVNVFGPFPYPKNQIEEMLIEVEHLEKRNNEIFTYVDNIVQKEGLASDNAQKEIHAHIPKSWNCRDYNQICAMHPICMKDSGWDDPLNSMCDGEGRPIYQVRKANHPVEFEDFAV